MAPVVVFYGGSNFGLNQCGGGQGSWGHRGGGWNRKGRQATRGHCRTVWISGRIPRRREREEYNRWKLNAFKIFIHNDNNSGRLYIKNLEMLSRFRCKISKALLDMMYDLSAADLTIVPAKGMSVMENCLSIVVPSGCYGRAVPRSGLTANKHIGIEARLIDKDRGGEVGVVVLKYFEKDMQVQMGDRIAHIILKEIRTSGVKVVADNQRHGAREWRFLGVQDLMRHRRITTPQMSQYFNECKGSLLSKPYRHLSRIIS